jgi:hypothetical protein
MSEAASTETSAPPAPPPVPRAITPLVAKRSWFEPRVRVWWIIAVIISSFFGSLIVEEVRSWMLERRIVAEGTLVKAKVTRAGDYVISTQTAYPDAEVALEFEYEKTTYDVTGRLAGRKEGIRPQSFVDIRIDPADPNKWTYRTDPPALGQKLLAPLMVLPVAGALLAVAAIKRNRLLKTWTTAPAKLAVVVSMKHTALAPAANTVQCAIPEDRDKKLYTVFLPPNVKLRKGAILWLLPPSHGKGPPIAPVTMM